MRIDLRFSLVLLALLGACPSDDDGSKETEETDTDQAGDEGQPQGSKLDASRAPDSARADDARDDGGADGLDGALTPVDASLPGLDATVDASGLDAELPSVGDAGSKRCGTRGGISCRDGEFCDYGAVDDSCGEVDKGGVCKPLTKACTKIYKPVCGCDGKTYGNECEAHSKGMAVRHPGECAGKPVPNGETCGGFAGIACGKGEFCNYAPPKGDGCVNIADGAGTCEPRPQFCTQQYDPVCGCDDKTYGNACMAHGAGISIKSRGPCEP